MKVLMFGWEFPPKYNGGLGIACEGIVTGLLNHGIKVNLVLPNMVEHPNKDINMVQLSEKFLKHHVKSFLTPYLSMEEYINILKQKGKAISVFGQDLIEEVDRYRAIAGPIAKDVDHDVIHAHDWMTYPAAIEAKKHSKKPMVAHIHATEFDRSGENPNPLIYQIEKLGFEHADKIIAVSKFTKKKLIKYYGIAADKIDVVHNAISKDFKKYQVGNFEKNERNILFLGRITMQKGPEYFLRAAKKVLDVEPNVNFLMVGDGDMMGQILHESIGLGIEKHVIFTGFLRGKDIDKAFQKADLFVMPSVSEPFGLVALEAIRNGVPVLISKQSGVSEVIKHGLLVDFWDVEEMANKMIMVLRYRELAEQLRDYSRLEFDQICWNKQAKKIKEVYNLVK